MSIKGYVDELEQIQSEIKRNNTRNRVLRQRAKALEANISEYLSQKGQSGLKYKGKAIVIENKEHRPAKKKKEKDADIISLLEQWGIQDAQNAYQKLQEVQKGEPVEQQKIKFQSLEKAIKNQQKTIN